MNVIEANGITKIYGTNKVVNNVDLSVKQGEIYGFLGRNGAGKSTFINIITGVSKSTSGDYKLLGESNLKNIHSRIGVLPDYSTFYDSLTAIGHLKYFSQITGKKIPTKHALDVLDRVGMAEHANQKAGKFSFGMKKKLGIAQAIVHNPDLIFLDEPTSGVDAESGLSIQQLIRELQQEGKTIFMTSHNLHEVEKICTRMAIMKKGSIMNEGSLDELRAHYNSSIHLQIKHSRFPSAKNDLVPQLLESLGNEVIIQGDRTSMVLESEKKIPLIVRGLTKAKVEIFRLNVHEPSLEDIFLQNDSTKQAL